MRKVHEMQTAQDGPNKYQFFAIREKNDINGNARHRVYIIPDGGNAVETILKADRYSLPAAVVRFMQHC